MNLNSGSIIKGIIVALIVAFVGYAVALTVIELFLPEGQLAQEVIRVRTLLLIAICFNILTINFFKSRKEYKSLRGALMTTMLMAIGWFIYFATTIL